MDIIDQLQSAIHNRSAAVAPQTDESIEAMRRAIETITELRGTLQTKCAHYSRVHHTGGWTCPACGARGTPNS